MQKSDAPDRTSYWRDGETEDVYFARLSLWNSHRRWLMSMGMHDQRARAMIGKVIKQTGDLIKADWAFRRVKDSNPRPGQVVAFLQQEMKNALGSK